MPDHYVFRATNLPISYNKKTKALQDLLHKRFNDDKSDSAGRVNGTFELVKADDDDKEPYVTFVPTKLQLDGEAVTAIFGVPNPLHPFLEELIPGSNKQVVKEYSTRVLSPSGLRRAVSIDSSFHGFTQMYPTTDGVDIEAEYVIRSP